MSRRGSTPLLSGRLVREVMSPLGPVLSPAANLAEATEAMRDSDRVALPVCEPTALLGTIFAEDIRRVASRESDLTCTTVRQAMRAEIQFCFDDQDERRIAQLMHEREIAHLVVLDRQRVPVGSLNLADLPLPVEEEATQ